MNTIINEWLPPAKGYLPYYMLSVLRPKITFPNPAAPFVVRHRRMYNGRFVKNPKLGKATATFNPEDSVDKLVPAHAGQEGIDQMTPVAARCFATWTFLTSIVRCYVSYHLSFGPMYDLGIWTYVVALSHFTLELGYFKTMKLGAPQLLPFMFASTGIAWMIYVRDFYVEA
ncbi:Ergosterol biosynthetic protein 28 [Ceratocystis platani]|uniref:Ergosterol biosynthetic protein 28 n=1 Tax=Ceratocystis fimbriata f. sp. platani TaxID=88771 RepID=A0A0F8B1Z0_CERFI|nr:Ergosterol biosynthetic protein 28 [Ceratocystis platani]